MGTTHGTCSEIAFKTSDKKRHKLKRYSNFFFQAEDGIRDVERSRGLGDVYKRQDYQGI